MPGVSEVEDYAGDASGQAPAGRDIGDLTTMLGLASDEELAQMRAVVARYAPAESDDLESLIYLGQLEMEGGKVVHLHPRDR